MAILSKEDFFSRLNERIGNDTSDDGINFLEDMTDTYNDLEKKANGNGEDWKTKYEENDKAWKEKYKRRFFSSGGGNSDVQGVDKKDEGYNPESVTIESLFAEK